MIASSVAVGFPLFQAEPFHVVEVMTPVPETAIFCVVAPEVVIATFPVLSPAVCGEKRMYSDRLVTVPPDCAKLTELDQVELFVLT
ncbi:hypothetical protein D3C72_492220 [compost metagenome]